MTTTATTGCRRPKCWSAAAIHTATPRHWPRKHRSSGYGARCRPTPCSRSCAACRRRRSPSPKVDAPSSTIVSMQIRPAQLAAHLARALSPLYVVHGDEPLLALEAGDKIRAAARAAGYDDREVLVAESGFKWDALAAANRNLGLFGSRKLIDLRIPGGKPGLEGGRVLEDCARHPSADTLLLITLPRLDRAASASAWFLALDQAGVTIAVYPLEREE